MDEIVISEDEIERTAKRLVRAGDQEVIRAFSRANADLTAAIRATTDQWQKLGKLLEQQLPKL